MAQKYFALEDVPVSDRGVWGLLRQNGHKIERWLPKQGWFEAPSEWAWLSGSRPGAREVTPEIAQAVMDSGRVVQLSDAQVQTVLAGDQ